MMIELITGASYARCCVHRIAAHSQVFFDDAYFSDRYFARINANSELRHNSKFSFKMCTFSLNISSGLYNRIEAPACIFFRIFPGANYFVAYILINGSIKFDDGKGYPVNKFSYEFKVKAMAQFFRDWSRVL